MIIITDGMQQNTRSSNHLIGCWLIISDNQNDHPWSADWSAYHVISRCSDWGRDSGGCARTEYHRETNVFVQTTQFRPDASWLGIWVLILFTFCFWSRAARGASPWCSSARCRCSSSSAGSRPAGPSVPFSSGKVDLDEDGFFYIKRQKKNILASRVNIWGPFRMSSIAHSFFWGGQAVLVNIIETNQGIC